MPVLNNSQLRRPYGGICGRVGRLGRLAGLFFVSLSSSKASTKVVVLVVVKVVVQVVVKRPGGVAIGWALSLSFFLLLLSFSTIFTTSTCLLV